MLTAIQYLGRAKEVSEFVKHGCQEAMIEIELAKDDRRFKRNVIFRCLIKKEGNKTIYSINGENKSKKSTVELARSLSIQIDNLCQFLPQDKVVEFAAMTPVELLRSTQRAVADQEMIDTHEFLKEKRKNQKDLQQRIDADQDILNNLEGRQRLQEADVERMREREQVVKHVDYLVSARPFAEYRHALRTHKEAKERRKAATEELGALTSEVEPCLKAVKDKGRYKKQCETTTEARRNALTKHEEYVGKIDKKYQSLVDLDKEIEDRVEAEHRGAKKHKSDVARIEGNISRLKKQMEDPPPSIDSVAYNEKIVGLLIFLFT